MLPIDFEGSNIIMNKPESMTDEECGSLYAYRDEAGFVECWKPSKEDIEAIVAGRPIWIKICSGINLPPVAVWTTDENNNGNF